MNRDIQWVNVRIPKSHWSQIVSDLEDMCGCSEDEIEILAEAEVTDEESYEPTTKPQLRHSAELDEHLYAAPGASRMRDVVKTSPCGGTSAFGGSCDSASCGWCHDNGWSAQ